jgi:hypothetical protein
MNAFYVFHSLQLLDNYFRFPFGSSLRTEPGCKALHNADQIGQHIFPIVVRQIDDFKGSVLQF